MLVGYLGLDQEPTVQSKNRTSEIIISNQAVTNHCQSQEPQPGENEGPNVMTRGNMRLETIKGIN